MSISVLFFPLTVQQLSSPLLFLPYGAYSFGFFFFFLYFPTVD